MAAKSPVDNPAVLAVWRSLMASAEEKNDAELTDEQS